MSIKRRAGMFFLSWIVFQMGPNIPLGARDLGAPNPPNNLLSYKIVSDSHSKDAIVTIYNDFLPWDSDVSNKTNAFQRVFGVGDFARSWKVSADLQRAISSESGWRPNLTLHPKCINSPVRNAGDADIEINTFMKPYDIFQGSIFLPRVKAINGHTDFLPRAAREASVAKGGLPYRQDLTCPTEIRSQAILPNADKLRSTYGQAAILGDDRIILVIDNSFNPLRWMANVGDNRIMHREQSSLGLVFPVARNGTDQIRAAFRDILNGITPADHGGQHLMLSYDINLSVSIPPSVDVREKFTDMLDRPCTAEVASQPADLFEASACLAMARNGNSPGWKQIKKYVERRIMTPSIQLSLGVVLDPGKPGVFPWRDQEFMLAEYNYMDSHPEGFAPTANSIVNTNTPIGNSNGKNAAWYRIGISALRNRELVSPDLPVLNDTASEWVMHEPLGRRDLVGSINLTNYLRNFADRHLIPGMSGEWGGCSALLPLDKPLSQLNTNKCDVQGRLGKSDAKIEEPLSVYRVLLIPEIHGPFRVEIEVKGLSLYFQ